MIYRLVVLSMVLGTPDGEYASITWKEFERQFESMSQCNELAAGIVRLYNARPSETRHVEAYCLEKTE